MHIGGFVVKMRLWFGCHSRDIVLLTGFFLLLNSPLYAQGLKGVFEERSSEKKALEPQDSATIAAFYRSIDKPSTGKAARAEERIDHLSGQQPATGSEDALLPFRDCDDCPEMVVIPEGSFLMGSTDDEEGRFQHEGPQHEVWVSRFAIGRYEITRAEFGRFVEATGHGTGRCVYWDVAIGRVKLGDDLDLDLHNPSHRNRQTGKHPMTCVSWDDAKAYVAWLRSETGKEYRLPSEAEWEYAARAGTTSRYFWNDGMDPICDYANGHDKQSKQTNSFNEASSPCDDGYGQTAPVGSFGANAFSLFDVMGNLWEWVEDHYHKTYEAAPSDRHPWLSTNEIARVLRGGSWENEPRHLRSASRIWSRPSSRLNSNGFRVAMTLTQ